MEETSIVEKGVEMVFFIFAGVLTVGLILYLSWDFIRRIRFRSPIKPSQILARAYRIARENENVSDSLHDGSPIGSIHAPASYSGRRQGK